MISKQELVEKCVNIEKIFAQESWTSEENIYEHLKTE
jgi:hypothetical protein